MRRLAALALAAAAGTAGAQDAGRGQVLYDTHCTECHYERVHKRDPSRSLVKTWVQLQSEVARRAESTKRRFSPDEIEDIAEYLNRSHYRLAR